MARRNLKMILRGQNVFLEGSGFLGKVGDIEPPKVEFEMVEDGNMGRKIDTGLLKPMECKLGLFDVNAIIYQTVGKRLNDTASFVIKQSTASASGESQVYFEIGGQVETHEPEGKEVGKETGNTLTVAITTYKLEIDGKEMYDIDVDNYICKIDGVDHYETLRKNIGQGDQ